MSTKQTLCSRFTNWIESFQFVQWTIKKVQAKRWEKKKQRLLSSFTPEQRKIIEVILDTQHRYVTNGIVTEYSTLSQVDWETITAKVFENLKVQQLVGIQPMTSPVREVYSLQYTETDSTSTPTGKSLTLEVIRTAVTAMSRKLQACWTIEAMQDLQSQHGLDLENETNRALSAEVVDDITHSILQNLITASEKIEPKHIDLINTQTATTQILLAINKTCISIAQDTRRGAGNWIVVSPILLELLRKDSNFTPTITTFERPNALQHAGTLFSSIDVYVVSVGFDNIESLQETVLVGYKGKHGELDTGYVYSPYIIIMPSYPVVDPQTFSPTIPMLTRYAETLFNPQAYYKTLTFSFQKPE